MSDRSPDSRPTYVRFLILALLMALCFVGHFNRVSISVAGTERMIKEFDIEPTWMGTVYSAYLLFYTLCMIPGGWLIDRRGAKFALAAMSVCSVPLVFATGQVRFLATAALVVPVLWVIRSPLGAVSAPLHPGAARMVWAWMPAANRNVSNGLVTAAALLAYATTAPLFGAMIDQYDWPNAFAICSVVTAVLAVLWIVCAADEPVRYPWVHQATRRLPSARPGEPEATVSLEPGAETDIVGPSFDHENPYAAPGTDQPRTALESASLDATDTPWWTLLSNRSLVWLTISFAAVGYFQYLFFFWIEHYLSTELHVAVERSRYYTSVCMLAMAAGMFLGGGVSDRLSARLGPRVGRAVLPITGMLTSALFLALGMASSEPGWIVAWFALALGALGTGEASFWTTAIELGGRRGGSAAAILNTGGNIGGVVAPVLTPYLGERLGWPYAMGLAGIMCVMGAMLWLRIDPGRTVVEQ